LIRGIKKSETKKFDGICHLLQLELYNASYMDEVFGSYVAFHDNLAISHFTSGEYHFDFTSLYQHPQIVSSIVDKCIIQHRVPWLTEVKCDGLPFKMKLPYIHGHIDKPDFGEVTSRVYEVALGVKGGRAEVRFATEAERHNFFMSLHTSFYKKLNAVVRVGVHPELWHLPWMGDYTEEWADERFCKFFELSEEESKWICNRRLDDIWKFSVLPD